MSPLLSGRKLSFLRNNESSPNNSSGHETDNNNISSDNERHCSSSSSNFSPDSTSMPFKSPKSKSRKSIALTTTLKGGLLSPKNRGRALGSLSPIPGNSAIEFELSDSEKQGGESHKHNKGGNHQRDRKATSYFARHTYIKGLGMVTSEAAKKLTGKTTTRVEEYDEDDPFHPNNLLLHADALTPLQLAQEEREKLELEGKVFEDDDDFSDSQSSHKLIAVTAKEIAVYREEFIDRAWNEGFDGRKRLEAGFSSKVTKGLEYIRTHNAVEDFETAFYLCCWVIMEAECKPTLSTIPKNPYQLGINVLNILNAL